MTQQELDAMSEALRSQGLTWSQTSFAVSLVRNGVAAERERCAKLVEQVADDCDEWRPLDGSRGVALRAAAGRIRGA